MAQATPSLNRCWRVRQAPGRTAREPGGGPGHRRGVQHVVDAGLPARQPQITADLDARRCQQPPAVDSAGIGGLAVRQRSPGQLGKAQLRMHLEDRTRRAGQPGVYLEDLVPQVEGLARDAAAGQPPVQRRGLVIVIDAERRPDRSDEHRRPSRPGRLPGQQVSLPE